MAVWEVINLEKPGSRVRIRIEKKDGKKKVAVT